MHNIFLFVILIILVPFKRRTGLVRLQKIIINWSFKNENNMKLTIIGGFFSQDDF